MRKKDIKKLEQIIESEMCKVYRMNPKYKRTDKQKQLITGLANRIYREFGSNKK